MRSFMQLNNPGMEHRYVQILKRNRRGMSLMEVTLAMFLASILLLAVFQTFFLSARFRILGGETNIDGISASNGIHDLQSDLVSLTRRGPMSTKESERRDNVISSSVRPTLAFADRFSKSDRLRWLDFVGYPHCLAIRVDASNPRFRHEEGTGPASGDSLAVWWIYKNASIPQIEAWYSNGIPVSIPIQVPANLRAGLIRTQFYRDHLGQENQWSLTVNPDVESIEFDYLFGDATTKEWKPSLEALHETGATMPNAIRVRMRLKGKEVVQWMALPQ